MGINNNLVPISFFVFFYVHLKRMQRIYDILTTLLGESKQGSFDKDVTQYQFNCPYCAEEKGGVDGKYNLEVSFAIGKFHCWSCGHAGPLSRLIKTVGGKKYVEEYFRIIKDVRENRYYDIDLFKDNGDFFEETYIKLPKTFRKINLDSCTDMALKAYLKERKITQDIIDKYNIGATSWDEDEWGWKKRIVIPSYDAFGNLNYYIGRTYTPKDRRIKYKNCTNDKNKIILHEDRIQWDADIYLVEGAIDCLYYDNCIGMMGKYLNKKMLLYNELFEKANANIIICLDGDTELKETKKIYTVLDHGRLKGHIKYVRLGTDDLPWKDFGEAYQDGEKEAIVKIMKSAMTFNEIELLYQ